MFHRPLRPVRVPNRMTQSLPDYHWDPQKDEPVLVRMYR
jgi:hypothetical protein